VSKTQQAFTLIELIITIMIIGILSATLMAVYTDVGVTSSRASGNAIVAAIRSELSSFRLKNRRAPTLQELAAVMHPPMEIKDMQYIVDIDAIRITIGAFQDKTCTQSADDVTSAIGCVQLISVGPIPPPPAPAHS
jgi:prepilin-type N-terminal cleavage/methylation domain-containing protein